MMSMRHSPRFSMTSSARSQRLKQWVDRLRGVRDQEAEIEWDMQHNLSRPWDFNRDADRPKTMTKNDIEAALNALDRASGKVSAAKWPGELEGIDQAGLYAWWADKTGADDLSNGLGHKVPSGHIYVGQTGATPSKATLIKRIGSNHIRAISRLLRFDGRLPLV